MGEDLGLGCWLDWDCYCFFLKILSKSEKEYLGAWYLQRNLRGVTNILY